jgi:hypothetical protein
VKGFTLDDLRVHYDARKLYPVDLTFEARHLFSAISDAEQWVARFADSLRKIGIERVTFPTIVAESASTEGADQNDTGASDDHNGVAAKASIDGSEENDDAIKMEDAMVVADGEESKLLPYDEFSRLCSASAAFTVDFPELR